MKPINLNQKRKERARADNKARADANAAKSGRTKAARISEAALKRDGERHLDLHKRDDAD